MLVFFCLFGGFFAYFFASAKCTNVNENVT